MIAVVMIFGSKSGFQSNLTSLTGLDPGKVISSATKGGFVTAPTSFSESAKFLIWPLLPLLGAVQSVGIGGEVKKVRRSQLFGMLGAVVATGLVIALFPAAAIGGGLLLATGAGGAVLGAVAGHAAGGMSRGDLKELGEQLDAGTAGLIVVGVSDLGAKVERAMAKAEKVERKELQADPAAIEQEAAAE